MLNAFIVVAVWVAIVASLAPLARHLLRAPRAVHAAQPIQQPTWLHTMHRRPTEGPAGPVTRAA